MKYQMKYLSQDCSSFDTWLSAKRGGVGLQDPSLSSLSSPGKARHGQRSYCPQIFHQTPAPSTLGLGGWTIPSSASCLALSGAGLLLLHSHPCARVLALRVGGTGGALRCSHLCPGPQAPRRRQD